MDDEKIVISSSAAISPEAVAGKGFTTSMRGYQPAEVRQFLNRVADELAAAVAREAELRRALHDTQTRAAHPELDEAVLTASLGEHAGRLIASARETAAAITAEAERTAAATLRDAEYRIARMRQEADTLMARRVDEADGVSASLRQSAEADARAIRDQAQAEAEAAIQAARSHGKEMVAEARAVRERMLGDLSRRRRVAEVQLEQLRVARDRLVEAYDVVRRTLEEVTAELAAAEPEARLAAEAVGRRMAEADPPPPLRIADPPLRPAAHSAPARRPAPPARWRRAVPTSRLRPPRPSRASPDRSNRRSRRRHRRRRRMRRCRPPSRVAPPDAGRLPASAPTASARPCPRHGSSGRAAPAAAAPSTPLPPMPPMPPSVAGSPSPTSRPDAGADPGTRMPGAPARRRGRRPRPAWDPGTWAGAGFGPPRNAGLALASHRIGRRHGPAIRAVAAAPRLRHAGAAATEPPLATGTPPDPRPPAVASGPAPGSVGDRRTSGPVPGRSRRTPAPRPRRTGAGPASATATAIGERDRRPRRADRGRRSVPQPVADSLPSRQPAPAAGTPDGAGRGRCPPTCRRRCRAAAARAAAGAGHGRGAQPSGPRPTARRRSRSSSPGCATRCRAGPGTHRRPTGPAAAEAAAPVDDVVDEGALARRDQQLDPLDADLTRSLKRILQDEQNEVLERLRQAGRAARLGRRGRPRPPGDGVRGRRRARPRPPPTRRAAATATTPPASPSAGKLADDLSAPLRERLERVVAAGGRRSGGAGRGGPGRLPPHQAPGDRAARPPPHRRRPRPRRLRRHRPAGRLLRWVVDDDGPCPDCDDNTLAGPTPKGEPFPTGQLHPPAHPGCRCLLVPVD